MIDLVRMVIEMITAHGAAKNWPVGSDIFDGESNTVMDHIRAQGWRRQHIPVWCEEAINDRGSRELKKCPPSGFYFSSREGFRGRELVRRITNSLSLLLWHQMDSLTKLSGL